MKRRKRLAKFICSDESVLQISVTSGGCGWSLDENALEYLLNILDNSVDIKKDLEEFLKYISDEK